MCSTADIDPREMMWPGTSPALPLPEARSPATNAVIQVDARHAIRRLEPYRAAMKETG
jgi:hypothetical protein